MPNRQKPRKLRILQRTNRKHRDHPEPEFPAVVGVPNPPAWLLDDADAVAEWRRLAPLLTDSHVLTEDNLTMLGVLCDTFAEYRRKRREGKITPFLVNQVRMIYADFGLTPTSRAKARPVGDGKKKNPFAVVGGS